MNACAITIPFQKSNGRRISAMNSTNSIAPPYEYTACPSPFTCTINDVPGIEPAEVRTGSLGWMLNCPFAAMAACTLMPVLGTTAIVRMMTKMFIQIAPCAR